MRRPRLRVRAVQGLADADRVAPGPARQLAGVLALALAALLGGCGDGGTGPDLPPRTWLDLQGRVFTIDGGEPGQVFVTVVSQAGRDSVAVSQDGTFRLQTGVAGDTIDYIVSGWMPRGPMYHPALIRTVGEAEVDLRVLLVPRQWTIDRGTYRGTTVSVSLDEAFRAPCADLSDINCDGFYPRVWTTGMKLWRADALPIPVAFDRAGSSGPIQASDSVAYWRIVERMNADFGTELYRPAAYEDLPKTPDGRAYGGVLVRIDDTLSGFGAWTNWWWNSAGELWTGVIRMRHSGSLRDTSLMTHELLHAQGFKHTCSWPTVMGGYGCTSYQVLSPMDVAHAHLALAVHARQQETGAVHGLVAALQGQRVVELGLPPFVPLDAARLMELRGDSIMDNRLER